MRPTALPKCNVVPLMGSLVTEQTLIQMSVGLEITMQRKSPGMKPMKCATLRGIDFVRVRKNWIYAAVMVAVITMN